MHGHTHAPSTNIHIHSSSCTAHHLCIHYRPGCHILWSHGHTPKVKRFSAKVETGTMEGFLCSVVSAVITQFCHGLRSSFRRNGGNGFVFKLLRSRVHVYTSVRVCA